MRSSTAGPRQRLVADVIAVRYRNIVSPAIGFPEWKDLAALCRQLVIDHPDLAGIVIGHGTATLGGNCILPRI